MAAELLADPRQVSVGRESEEQFVTKGEQLKTPGGPRTTLTGGGI
jgi:hypothetical protein